MRSSPFASERSVGRELDGGLIVNALSDEAIQGFDIALFSAGGSTSGEWAPRFAAAGATVIDNSSRWRMQDDVPLVVSEVNPDALAGHHGIIANPNCSTMQMVVALKPIYDAAGIERLVISTYQAVSGTGRGAVDELLDQSHALLHESEPDAPQVYAHRIAFNALPHAGYFAPGEDHTDEESKLMSETRKILGDDSHPDQRDVRARARRERPLRGRERRRPASRSTPTRRVSCLRAAPGVIVADDPQRRSTRSRSTPADATRSSSGGSAATAATSAHWTSGSSPTTCARAPRRTPCSSPSCSSSAACSRAASSPSRA